MTTLPQLTPAEKKDLELCGISSQEQLLQISPEHLWLDLQKTVQYFPGHQLSITQ